MGQSLDESLLSRGGALLDRVRTEIASRTLARDERVTQAREAREALNLLARAEAMPDAEREATQSLKSSAEAAARNLEAMEQTIQAAREIREEAQGRIASAAPLAYHGVKRSGPASRAALTWGLLMESERRRAQNAVETELRVEGMLGERAEARAAIESHAEARGRNTRLKPEQARRRRDELMDSIQNLGRLAASDNRALDDLEEFAAEVELAMAAVSNSSLPVARERLGALIENADARIAGEPARPARAPRRVDKRGEDARVKASGELQEIEDEAPGGSGPGAGTADAGIHIDGADSPNREVFAPDKDTPIHAPAAGAVIFSGPFADARHILIIDHGGGWATLYGNMSFCDLVEGDNVEAGQKLGEFTPAGPGDEPIPFWFEVRLHGQSHAVKNWPAAGDDWRRRLFNGAPPPTPKRTGAR